MHRVFFVQKSFMYLYVFGHAATEYSREDKLRILFHYIMIVYEKELFLSISDT